MVLPITYPPIAAAAIASYDYTDIAEGSGITKFYAFTTIEESTTSFNLSTNAVFSQNIDTEGVFTTGSYAIAGGGAMDKDFDLTPFNLPKTIKGTAIINLTWFIRSAATAPVSGYIIAKVRKYSATAGESEIASTQSNTIVNSTSSNTFHLTCLKFTIPKTHFKKGDILRLTIQAWGKKDDGNNGTIGFGFDPQNRDGTNITPSSDDPLTTTKLEFYCPFELDV
jgi:hypothetical protein